MAGILHRQFPKAKSLASLQPHNLGKISWLNTISQDLEQFIAMIYLAQEGSQGLAEIREVEGC